MTSRTNQLKLDAPFSLGLKNFLIDLGSVDWSSIAPSCLFFRDFEYLPYSAPFDVDLLCKAEEWCNFSKLVNKYAKKHDLRVATRSSENSLHVLFIDIDGSPDTRRHLFFEVRSTLRIPANQFAVAPSRTIEVEPDIVPRTRYNGLPVPVPAWQCAFLSLQALRKPNPLKYIARIKMFDKKEQLDATDALASRFGFKRDEIEHLSDLPHATVKPLIRGRTDSQTIPERLRHFCVKYLFFLQPLHLEFFTIHGPDGVGKSTSCEKLAELFDGLPIGLYQFHHSAGWKESRRRTKASDEHSQSKTSEQPRETTSRLRRLVRNVYRIMPLVVQEFWLWNSHFTNYNRKFTQFLFDHRNAGKILFADRYVYDVRVKYIVETPHPKWTVRAYYWIHCVLVPKPRFGFVLVDAPAAIASRKAELTEHQISQFIDWITRILLRRRVSHIAIPVAGRTPRAIAREIMQHLLELKGPELIAYMRAYVSQTEDLECHSQNKRTPDESH